MGNHFRKFQLSERKFNFKGKQQHNRNDVGMNTCNPIEKKWHIQAGHSSWFKNSIFRQWSGCVCVATRRPSRAFEVLAPPVSARWNVLKVLICTFQAGGPYQNGWVLWPPFLSPATGIPPKPVGEKDINRCYTFERPGSHRPFSKW